MKLRTKVLLIIVISWVLMLAITYVGSQKIIVHSYIQLEDQLALANVKRANHALNQMVEGVATVLGGWAIWDDAYQFVKTTNAPFIQANLEVSVLASADIDVILFYDEVGKPAFERVLNADRTQEAPIPQSLVNALRPNGKLWHVIYGPTMDSQSQGLFDTERGLLLMASHVILDSKGLGPPHGTMIMGKFFNNDVLNKLKEITKLNVVIYPLRHLNQYPDLNDPYKKLLNLNNIILEKNSQNIFGYKLLDDIDGHHIAILKVTLPRSVFVTGVNTTRFFNVAFIILGFILAFILFYLFRIMIINRLENINDKIIEIGEKKNFSIQMSEKGHDELAALSKETNELLSVLRYQDQERQALINEIGQEIKHVNSISDALAKAQNLFKDVLDSMPSILLMIDKKLMIQNINVHGKKVIGHLDIQNKSVIDLFPYLAEYKKLLHSAFTSDKKQTIDKISTFENGIKKYYSVVLFRINRLNDFLLVLRIDDVTEKIFLQERLMQSDKMSSIGILTAGVAHEINNPINFISSSINPFKNNLSKIIDLLHQYDEINLEKNSDEKLKKIEEFKKSIDLDYLIQETHQLLDGIKDGAARTATIVKDLRSFTKLSEDILKKFDVREGIDSSLTLLQHNFKDRIKLIKNYQEVPEINCYPGRINQVFMNILSNAIDAIKNTGEIIITIQKKDDDHVLINIKDNGMGIPKENLQKIFDPFYTTKEVGAGTGLGLSISKTIINDHQGTIDVKSTEGKGSEFIIILPITPQETTHSNSANNV